MALMNFPLIPLQFVNAPKGIIYAATFFSLGTMGLVIRKD